MAGGPLGRGQRLLVAAEAVVEQRARPLRDGNPDTFAPQRHFLHGGFDQRDRRGLVAPEGGKGQGAVGREIATRRLNRHLHLLDH